MIELVNPVTNAKVCLSDEKARRLFNLENGVSMLVCMPSKVVVSRAGAQTIRVYKKRSRAKRLGGTCVIRMGGLGDLIMLSSTLAKLKKKDPGEPLTLATMQRYIGIMKELNGVDNCIPIDDLDRYRFDRTIDLRFAVEPVNIGPGSLPWRDYVSKDRSENFDQLCGVNSKRRFFNIPVDREARKKFENALATTKRPLIGLNPSCSSIFRAMPPEYVRPTIERLEGLGATVVILGKTEEWNRSLARITSKNIVNFVNKTSEEELIALCSMMDVIVTPDTGVLHIAGALKRKCVGLFGNIAPHTRISYYPTVKVLYPKDELPCVPCFDVPGACDSRKPGAPCMRLLTPQRIVQAVKEIL